MTFLNPYFTTKTKLDLLARWLIIHSIAYYELDEAIVSDHQWSSNAVQFVKMRDKHSGTMYRWRYVMHDFDASTGFDLAKKLTPSDKNMLLYEIRTMMKMLKSS